MNRAVVTAALASSFATAAAHAATLAGPVVNPANGHTYYLLTPNSWTASEAEAVALGGHLVTVNDAAENAFVSDTFGGPTNPDRDLWLGLNDAGFEGNFAWADGDSSAYRNFSPGQPDNQLNAEDYVQMLPYVIVNFDPSLVGRWNDLGNLVALRPSGESFIPIYGVVEVIPEPASLAVFAAACLTAIRRRTRGR